MEKPTILYKESGLSETLDFLWQRVDKSIALPRDLTANLKPVDWLALYMWEIAALYGPDKGLLEFDSTSCGHILDQNQVKYFSIRASTLAEDSCYVGDLIYFSDCPFVIQILSCMTPVEHPTLTIEPASTLITLQQIRDHIDSTYFLPTNLRENRWREMAELGEKSYKEFKSLLTWYPQIQAISRKTSRSACS